MRKYFWKELVEVIKRPEIWFYMALIDIQLRYKRTALGPFWLVIVSFITILCIAALGTILFRVKWGDFFPYVACGMVVWTYIAAMITDCCTLYIAQLGIIKHINVPLLSFGFRSFVRNTIIFVHSIPVLFLILLYYGIFSPVYLILLIPALLIFTVTTLAMSILIGFACTRYRDVLQLIQALIGILAFMTPIMWQPKMLGEHQYLANFNPFTHYIAIIREPLLGHIPDSINYIFTTTFAFVTLGIAAIVYNKYRKELVHWL